MKNKPKSDSSTNEPDSCWFRKNFRMNQELHIAGNFIYDGINTLNGITGVSYEQTANLFSFLYYVSVGIERLQKIILILLDGTSLYDEEKIAEFEERLKTHNHVTLQQYIKGKTDIQLNERENRFLRDLSEFYKEMRYSRYNFITYDKDERSMVTIFLKRFVEANLIEYSCADAQSIRINDIVKETMGRVVGGIATKYYTAINEWCHKQDYPFYTYELQCGSKAEKVFTQHANSSLQKQKNDEVNALRELLILVRNAKPSNGFLRFLDGISPIDIDQGLLSGFIIDLCNGNISQDLIDEVKELYAEVGGSHLKKRLELISGIGNPNATLESYEESDLEQTELFE